jgi:hypothetical protein
MAALARRVTWAWRPMMGGIVVPAVLPSQRTSMLVRSNGSETSSTLRPARDGPTW